jgi:serine/threonine-protein kinase
MRAMGTGDTRCPRCGAEVPEDARFCASCGYATPRLATGQILDGKYEILDKLAEGGMGHVYRARHLHLDEIRIIKVTKPDPLGDASEARRFQEEARIATLVRHPNVAGLYDFSRLPDGSFYMVWEFIDGVTLEQWLRTHGPMPPARALHVARQVLSGLSEIHAQGIVHRDLAPDNIMLREGPGGRLQAKIIDLGIAKRVAAEAMQMTGTGLFVGKLKYCSPEQAGALARGESIDGRSDLYSFGVVLYEMLAGRPPFEAETPEAYLGQHLHTPAPALDTSRWPGPFGAGLAAVLKRALEKNRNRRFRDAAEFQEALARLEPLAPAAGEAGPEAGPARPSSLWPAASVAALLVLAAAIGVYALIHRGSRRAPQRVPAPITLPVPTPSSSAVEASGEPGSRTTEGTPAPSRASSRNVADVPEAGAPAARPTAAAKPRESEPSAEESDAAVGEVPAQMDAEATRRFRNFYRRWPSQPVERQAAQARSLARFASLFVHTYPDDPLSGEVHRDLPASFKRLALAELDAGRPRLAARFFEAYRALDFAPPDEALDRRFAARNR